jgi:hypothetical protein
VGHRQALSADILIVRSDVFTASLKALIPLA